MRGYEHASRLVFELAELALAFSQAPNLSVRCRSAIRRPHGGGKRAGIPMEVYTKMKHVRIAAMVLAVCLLVVCQSVALAQNLGTAPQVNVAVQGQPGRSRKVRS